MKRIYLIGDSIRMGYDSYVRELLSDRAQVYWPNDCACFVAHTFRYLTDWVTQDLDASKMDIVHWNNGLWDVLRLIGDEPQTTPEEYRTGLKRIAGRIRRLFPQAKIIFALTTCVVEEWMNPDFMRYNADIERYNQIAREVMAEEGIEINDLYAVSRAMPREFRSPDGTHYKAEGSSVLAEAVAKYLEQYLN